MSHEHNRDDKPIDCSAIDPEIVNGQYIWGNLKIGNYDPWSIMNYCNTDRINFPFLTNTDKAGLLAFFGRVPWENTELGYSVITIPVVLNGSTKIPNNLILTDQNGDGRYTYCCLNGTKVSGKTSVEVTYNTNGDRVLDIPFLLRTTTISGIRIITGIDKMTMTRNIQLNTFKDESNSRTEILPSDTTAMINDTSSVEWIINWIYAFESGMLLTMLFYILNFFKNIRFYNYFYRIWLSILILLYFFTFMKLGSVFRYGEWIIFCVILVFLVTITPATYQYRKKAGILRKGDSLLFSVALILYALNIYNLFSNLWPKYKHLLEW